MPLLLLCILIGLGIFGVASWETATKSKQRDDARQLAITTASSFNQTIEEAYPVIASLGTLIDLTRLWSATLGNFSVSMDRMKLHDGQLMTVQIAPQLVISAVYPPYGYQGGLGLDILDPESCKGCTEDAMRQVAAETSILGGPFDMTAGWDGPATMAFIISMPIFLNTTWAGPGPEPTWQVPLSKGSCTLPQCNVTLGPGRYRTWLLELDSTQLPRLQQSGWQYSIRRAAPLPAGVTNVREWITTNGLAPPVHPEDPVVVSLTMGTSEADYLVFELMLAPSEGWGGPWWPAVYVLVVLSSIIICTLFFFTLQARRQKTWLLYSLLPKKVVKALRNGRLWSQKSDCCVLFADVVGFTSITSTMSVDAVGSLVGELFSIYEDLCRQHGVAKVCIIGDCFLAATGLDHHHQHQYLHLAPILASPLHAPAHAAAAGVDIIGDCFMAATGLDLGDKEDPAEKDPLSCATRAASLALDMVESCRQVLTPFDEPIQVRIGLHAGPVVSMLVGVHSPKLTVFGDVVNSCSRIQSTSLPGKIQVSEIVSSRLGQAGKVGKSMELKERGEVELKGRGKAQTWWLSRPEQEREEASDILPSASSSITPRNTKTQNRRRSDGINYLNDSRSNFFIANGSNRNMRDKNHFPPEASGTVGISQNAHCACREPESL
eukprot:gene5338-12933_t